MIIQASTIHLTSQHTAIENHTREERLRFWHGARPDDSASSVRSSSGQQGRELHHGKDQVALSPELHSTRPQRAMTEPVKEDEQVIADLNIRILRAMIQRLTGRVLDIRQPQGVADEAGLSAGQAGSGSQTEGQTAGFGLEYDYYESHYEYETTSFASQGHILTGDGQQIEFSVQLNMSREFMSEKQLSIRAGDALKDPLVINFDGGAVQLTQDTFAFDLDADGRNDQIAFVDRESGFLALDRNQDNIINDGTELFGAATGNGFEELAGYDQDGNGWIDENDDIFHKLRIWALDGDGNKRLFALGEKGIGAIYLHHISTPFSLKDQSNQLIGQLRDTGLVVRESGTVGTIQQIDLAV